jgi:hypothetical protein
LIAPTTPDDYIESLPPGRREAIAQVRDVINANLPQGYQEGMLYGIIGWYVPLERFPDTYNTQPLTLAGLANRKSNMMLYLNNVYGNPKTERWFKNRWAETGKKLNMGSPASTSRRLRISRSTSSLRSSLTSHSTNSSLTTRRFEDRRGSPGWRRGDRDK